MAEDLLPQALVVLMQQGQVPPQATQQVAGLAIGMRDQRALLKVTLGRQGRSRCHEFAQKIASLRQGPRESFWKARAVASTMSSCRFLPTSGNCSASSRKSLFQGARTSLTLPASAWAARGWARVGLSPVLRSPLIVQPARTLRV